MINSVIIAFLFNTTIQCISYGRSDIAFLSILFSTCVGLKCVKDLSDITDQDVNQNILLGNINHSQISEENTENTSYHIMINAHSF